MSCNRNTEQPRRMSTMGNNKGPFTVYAPGTPLKQAPLRNNNNGRVPLQQLVEDVNGMLNVLESSDEDSEAFEDAIYGIQKAVEKAETEKNWSRLQFISNKIRNSDTLSQYINLLGVGAYDAGFFDEKGLPVRSQRRSRRRSRRKASFRGPPMCPGWFGRMEECTPNKGHSTRVSAKRSAMRAGGVRKSRRRSRRQR